MKSFMKEMFSGFSGHISSKRVMGCLGWLLLLVIYGFAFLGGNETPNIDIEPMIIATVALLGVDSVTSIFKKA